MKLNFRLRFVLTLFRRNYNISMNIYHLSESKIKETLKTKLLTLTKQDASTSFIVKPDNIFFFK